MESYGEFEAIGSIAIPAIALSDEWHEGRLSAFKEQVAFSLTSLYGERCPEYQEGCACCEVWRAFDIVFAEPWN